MTDLERKVDVVIDDKSYNDRILMSMHFVGGQKPASRVKPAITKLAKAFDEFQWRVCSFERTKNSISYGILVDGDLQGDDVFVVMSKLLPLKSGESFSITIVPPKAPVATSAPDERIAA